MTDPRRIRRLLVANRGEIAGRVFATCRRLGIETVAVHSDADAGLGFVTEADLAVRLLGDAPADTYLRGDLLVEAARRAAADAIHPGYGFLSENAAFEQEVLDAGLTWVGPAPEVIAAMGDKVRAKELAREAGVPVLDAPAEPTEADLPLLVKAAAGGGGRGMRVVSRLSDLEGALAAAAAEARSAFGDGTVFVERYVERGRHVEVQVWGDAAGEASVLGDRDCSVQRRHQKVVEEAPAPGLPDAVRKAMHDAARSLADAIGYVGAGTVEFIYDPERESFAFLEMNTRLQVEHPVTELVTGLDLVELQLRAAEGGTGTLDPATHGHAIEARLYAEDPDQGYAPQTGRLLALDLEADRLDAGYGAGDTVSIHYDPMLAKVICHGPDRDTVARRLAGVLRRARVHGVTTNRAQLVDVLTDPVFVAGDMTTTWLERREPRRDEDPWLPVAAALMLAAADAESRTVQAGIPAGWRNVPNRPQRTSFHGHDVEWWGTRHGFAVDGATVEAATSSEVRLTVDGVMRTYRGSWTRGQAAVGGALAPREVWVDGPDVSACLRETERLPAPSTAAAGGLLAPMPGSVVRVAADSGTEVAAGDPVVVLEAMKMQHTVTAPTSGVLTHDLTPGQQVAAGDVLAVIEEEQA